MARLAEDALAVISFISLIISLYVGLSGHGPGPQWLWTTIAYAALLVASPRLIYLLGH